MEAGLEWRTIYHLSFRSVAHVSRLALPFPLHTFILNGIIRKPSETNGQHT